MCRYNLHEIYRHIPRVRASSSSGRPIDGPRRIADGNCPNPGRSAGLPVSVESPSTAPRRAERPSASGSSRAPESGPGSSVSRLAQERRYGAWVVQQPVDGGARNRNDSTPLRPVVSSRACAQDRQTALRLDQSANSSSSPRARRKKDRCVARSPHRADPKKKRNSKRPISSSKMNRALCLGPRVGAPSRPGGRHPSKRPGIGMTASRPSVCSRSVPTATNPIFSLNYCPIIKTSTDRIWSLFCANSDGICLAPSCWYGMAALSIGQKSCSGIWNGIPTSTLNPYPPMRPNSIRMKGFGRIPNMGAWQTTHPKIRTH